MTDHPYHTSGKLTGVIDSVINYEIPAGGVGGWRGGVTNGRVADLLNLDI